MRPRSENTSAPPKDLTTACKNYASKGAQCRIFEERPALQPLPLEPFGYYQYGERTVHLDGCVEIDAAYYSAAPGWIGRQVQVQWDAH